MEIERIILSLNETKVSKIKENKNCSLSEKITKTKRKLIIMRN